MIRALSIPIARLFVGLALLVTSTPPTAGELRAMVMSLPNVPDGTKTHSPIVRDAKAVEAMTNACALTSFAIVCAICLDVILARESGYQRHTQARDGTWHETAGDCPGMPAGDRDCTRERGAKSCGPFQTSCSKTPAGATGFDQAKIAARDFETAIRTCPDHPMWAYATGKCEPTWTGKTYERIAKANAATVSP